AEASESRHHLIEDEQDVMTAKHRYDLLEIPLRRRNQAPRAHDRLGEECSDRVRTLALNELLELAREMAGELPFAHAGRRLPVMMWTGGMKDGTEGHVEQRVHAGQAGQASRGDSRPVISVPAGDHLLLLGEPAQIVVVPDQLQLRLVGIAPGGAEEYAGHGDWRAG